MFDNIIQVITSSILSLILSLPIPHRARAMLSGSTRGSDQRSPLASRPIPHSLSRQLSISLIEIARTSRAHGAEFTVVLSPYAAQLSDELVPNPLNAELARFLTEQGVAVVDLLPMLRASAVSADSLYVDSVHFSARGNRVVGELLAGAIPEPASGDARVSRE